MSKTVKELEQEIKELKDQVINMALHIKKLEEINEDAFLRNLEMSKQLRLYQQQEKVKRYDGQV